MFDGFDKTITHALAKVVCYHSDVIAYHFKEIQIRAQICKKFLHKAIRD